MAVLATPTISATLLVEALVARVHTVHQLERIGDRLIVRRTGAIVAACGAPFGVGSDIGGSIR